MKKAFISIMMAVLSALGTYGSVITSFNFDSLTVGDTTTQLLEDDTGILDLSRGTSMGTSVYKDPLVVAGYGGSGSALYFTTAVNGGCIALSGSATPCASVEKSTFTISAMINPEANPTGDYATLISLNEYSSNPQLYTYQIRLQEVSGQLYLAAMFTDSSANQVVFTNSTAIALGSWSEILVSHDADSNMLYLDVNGNRESFSTPFDPTTDLIVRTFSLGSLRTYSNIYSNPYQGSIDNIVIDSAAIPEPASMGLLLMGSCGLAVLRRVHR
ncbi:MAG: LamG-like jellyroll fold domain-containing protein [Kiritimatiellales bacterium]